MSEGDPKGQEASDGAEFAWKVHDALDSWTGKVDTKASIVLAMEAALAGFVITLSGKDGRLAGLHGYRVNLDRFGLGFLIASVLLSLAVVWPQLGRRSAKQNWPSNMIYFGHLRRWDPDRLAAELAKGTPTVPQLALQLVTMSKINWRKHAWLQVVAAMSGRGLRPIGVGRIMTLSTQASLPKDAQNERSTPLSQEQAIDGAEIKMGST